MGVLIRCLIDYEPIGRADRFLTYADPVGAWLDPTAPDLNAISLAAFGLTRDQAKHLVSTSREYIYVDDEGGSERSEQPVDEPAANDDLYADERWDIVQEIESASASQKVAMFRSLGWDVLNHKREPAVILQHIDIQLAMGTLGLVGGVPEVQPRLVGGWADALQRDAERFVQAKRA